MSQEEVVQAIQNILGNNNELRKQSEESLRKYREQYPNEFITMLSNLLKSQLLQPSRVKYKKFCCCVIEKEFIYLFREVILEHLVKAIRRNKKLNHHSQQFYEDLVKQTLLSSLETEQSSPVRHQIADTIGELGGSLIEMSNNQWPELPQVIWQLLGNDKNYMVENGLKILSGIFAYASDYFLKYQQQLYTVFQQGMVNLDDNIRCATIEAFSSLIEVIEFKDAKLFEPLSELLIKSSFELIQKNEIKGDLALNSLSTICENEPKFLRKQLSLFIDLMYQVTFNKSMGDELKRTATENSLQLVEKLSNSIKDQKENLNKVIEMVFAHMVQIPLEISPEWEKPQEGYNEDVDQNSDMENVRYGTNGIDRIISAVGEKQTLPLLSEVVQKMLMQTDWRYKHAAIMALSQVGEYIEDINEIVPIVNLVMNYINDPNAKIRYSVCHCIGQIADDMSEFQEKFHAQVLPILIKLMDDPIPRVQSHAAAAITNFVEGMDKELTALYVNEIIIKSFEKLKDGICIVKETVISAIAATAEAAKEFFTPYYSEGAQFLLQMLSSHNSPAYRQLRGQIIECITLMSHAVGKENFKPILGFLVQKMLEIQETQLAHVDPQKQYLLAAWQRICMILQKVTNQIQKGLFIYLKDFAEYLPTVLPSIFKLMSTVLDEQSEFTEKKLEINTNATEEAEIAMTMLSVIIDETKELFIPYIEKASQIILPLLSYSTNETIRASACKCLPKLIGSIKTKDVSSAIQCAKIFLGALWQAVQEELSASIIYDQVNAIRDCFREIGQEFLTVEEMNEMEKKVLQMLMDSDKRKTENEDMKKAEDLDEDDVELFDMEIVQEEDLHIAIAELIGILLSTHPNLSIQIYNILLTQILPKVLQPQISPRLQEFGLQLIVFIIQGLKYQTYEARLPEFADVFIKYSSHEQPSLRKVAALGIGKLAERIQGNQQIIAVMVQAILQAISSAPAKTKELDFKYNYFKDNAVSALGKIIQFHSQEINFTECYQIWIDHLPLRNDRIEATYQHDFLLNLLANQLSVAIGNQGQNLPKIVKILAGILEIRTTPKIMQQRICQMFRTFKADELISKHWNQIISALSESQRKKIEEFGNVQN